MVDIAEYTNKTDKELVQMTLKNKEVFAYLINRYEKKLFFYIMRITHVGEEDVRDLLQEIFIKVYRNLNGFDSQLKFSSWIYRIAHNHIISNFRKLEARPKSLSGEVAENAISQIVSDFDFEREMDIKILRENLFSLLDKIDLKYREVLILKFLEEKSYDEIADIIKKPLGTVGSLINRAKKKLTAELKKQNINMSV